MALQTNSYGSAKEIAALSPRYASAAGNFDDTTRPTLAQVESEADQISAILNAILADEGFAIPVTQADAKLMLDKFVNEEVAAIVLGINGSGRFGPANKRGGNRFMMIMDDVRKFVDNVSVGLVRLGATRTYRPMDGVAYRSTDESGDASAPIFQREAFGNTIKDWDK